MSVPLNHRSNFLEPFTKQKAAKRNNGVVGIKGNTIPIIPNPRDKNPANINSALTIVLMIIISLPSSIHKKVYLISGLKTKNYIYLTY